MRRRSRAKKASQDHTSVAFSKLGAKIGNSLLSLSNSLFVGPQIGKKYFGGSSTIGKKLLRLEIGRLFYLFALLNLSSLTRLSNRHAFYLGCVPVLSNPNLHCSLYLTFWLSFLAPSSEVGTKIKARKNMVFLRGLLLFILFISCFYDMLSANKQ